MSRPKKPNTGQAPIIQNATPAAKLTTLRNAISTIKPVRFNERCGVNSAENNSGSGGTGSKSLPAVIAPQYTRIMAKITHKTPPKKTPPKKTASKKAPSKKLSPKSKPSKSKPSKSSA